MKKFKEGKYKITVSSRTCQSTACFQKIYIFKMTYVTAITRL